MMHYYHDVISQNNLGVELNDIASNFVELSLLNLLRYGYIPSRYTLNCKAQVLAAQHSAFIVSPLGEITFMQ